MTETLQDLQRRYGGGSAPLRRSDIEKASALAAEPRSWRSAPVDISRIRRWLMHYLNLSSSELDRMLLGHFVRDHASEFAVEEDDAVRPRIVGRVP